MFWKGDVCVCGSGGVGVGWGGGMGVRGVLRGGGVTENSGWGSVCEGWMDVVSSNGVL